MSYEVQGLDNNHAGAMFPESCTFITLTPAESTAILARGTAAMNQLNESSWAQKSKEQKLQTYMQNISQFPQTAPEFFNVVGTGGGLWRVPYLGGVNGGIPAEAMVGVLKDLRSWWRVVGRGVGRYEGDVILKGALSESELKDVRRGRFPPTLAEWGRLALVPGVCDGTVVPGRPREYDDPQPTPRVGRSDDEGEGGVEGGYEVL
ncbi:MAG: hypothetical protein LQ350_005161 [Teloschistes chrysophthalmus]|nr:MAG: hypothetical protein LQ350_005161 [Niorma chrysophthalma]